MYIEIGVFLVSTETILNNITNQYFSMVIGHKGAPPILYMGNATKSVKFALKKESDPLDALLNAEFVRYSVMKEVFTFVCFVTRAMTVLPSDLKKMSDLDISALNTIEKVTAHPAGKEVIQFNLEMNGKLYLRSFEVQRGYGDLILNMTAIEELSHNCSVGDVQSNGAMGDFFSGLKTDVLQQQPDMIDSFNKQLAGLYSASELVTPGSAKH